MNLIWTFIDSEVDPPSWDQICRMLDTFAIVVYGNPGHPHFSLTHFSRIVLSLRHPTRAV